MIDKEKLKKAQEWADQASEIAQYSPTMPERAKAAAEVIKSLPDTIVDGEELGEWRDKHKGSISNNGLDDLEALLPAPPAPESAAPHPEDVPEFDPAYTYSDRIGNEWSYVIQAWRCFSTKSGKLLDSHLPTPPAKFGPYTRIEDNK